MSWRLDDDALKALAILESQQPGKERAQIVGEHLIKAAGDEPPLTIQFNELDPREILHIRADLAENRRIVDELKIALRKAKPNSTQEGKRLSDAIIEATRVLALCLKHDKELRQQARNTAQIKAEEVASLQWVYNKASNNHMWAVRKIAEEGAEARTRAENWAKLAKFCLIFRPDLGPELKTPVVLATVQKAAAMSAPAVGGAATNFTKPQ